MIYETLNVLKEKYGVDLKGVHIEDVRIGVFETYIELSNNTFGLASTLINSNEPCYRMKRDESLFSTGYIRNKNLVDLYYNVKSSSIIDTLRVAALNALSAPYLNEENYHIKTNCDPFSLLDLEGKKTICVVGAFKSYIHKLAETQHDWYVVELDGAAMEEKYTDRFVHTDDSASILQKADAVIITGFSLVNNTFQHLNRQIPENCQVVLVGPSSSFIPDVVFQNNVNIMGATRITDPATVKQLASEGACGFHFFKHHCAEKLCLLHE
jgi:uncharacterized protein (DUF4213/DUF364 family)